MLYLINLTVHRLITNDGVTIAKEIELEDAFENMGAQLVKEVATKTNDVAGDGTTTATVLAQAMINEGMKNLAAGANPIILKKRYEEGYRLRCRSNCMSMSQCCNRKRTDCQELQLFQQVMKKLVRWLQTLWKRLSNDGVITIEESKTMKTELDLVEGMQFDRGYISAYMATDMEKMEATS